MNHRTLTILCMLGALLPAAATAATISGRVTNERGEGLAGVDLDFIVVSTGAEEKPSGDTTDALGYYTTILPDEVYDVYYSPVPGTPYAGHVERNVNLNLPQTVDVVLADAYFVRGKVLRADTGGPAVNVDLDFENVITGEKIFTPADNTDLLGEYSVPVPVGIYVISYEGPAPDLVTDPPQLAPALAEGEISVTGDGELTLPTITLEPGYEVSGSVLDFKGDAVNNADLDFIEQAGGTTIFTKGDNTNAQGRFKTIVPSGTYRIKIKPAALDPSPASMVENVVVAGAPVDIGTVTLPEGFGVTGFARTPTGEGLWGVRLEVSDATLGDPVPVNRNGTAADGSHHIRLASGSYDIRFQPRRDPLYDETLRPNVLVLADTDLGDTVLPAHDQDGDAVADIDDNCPFVANPGQADGDGDGRGDACDLCPAATDPAQRDNDGDGRGDACDDDDDNDGIGDAADNDRDGDGRANTVDNCPSNANPDQRDRDLDGIGDACDDDDGLVGGLRPEGGELAWSPETGALSYNVYRVAASDISSLNYGTCRARRVTAPLYREITPVPAGQAFCYVVTVMTAGGEGSMGQASSGAERSNLRTCP
ncbi:MAG: thrombospondin type 3 repeat-containing protein [Acidobacteriota bacterium]|nr:thrombospondin type 3 repeat-containing protein [Acidobacteriota bacterium]